MLKKLLPAVVAVYVLWLTSVHMNDKLMRGYFMAPLKFKELVAEDNMSEREEDFGFKPSTPLREGLRRFAEWYGNFYCEYEKV